MSKPKMIKAIDGFAGVSDAEVLSRGTKYLICACTGLPRQDLELLFEFKDVTEERAVAALRRLRVFLFVPQPPLLFKEGNVSALKQSVNSFTRSDALGYSLRPLRGLGFKHLTSVTQELRQEVLRTIPRRLIF